MSSKSRTRAVTSGVIPWTPRAKKVLDGSLREALALGHNYIGTEHMLLALAREDEGVAARILEDLGPSREQVRDAVMKTLHVGFPRFTAENVAEVYVEPPVTPKKGNDILHSPGRDWLSP